MSTVPKHIWTEEEYLRREEQSPEKHEFYRGEVFQMAGASARHNAIADNFLMSPAFSKLGATGCRPFSSNQRIKVVRKGLTTYPDLSVVCGRWELDDVDNQAITNPKVLIEVLSPSTESYDRTDKFEIYKHLPSFQEYVLVAQDRPRIEVWTRQPDDSWTPRTIVGLESTLEFLAISAAIPLTEIYKDIEFDAPTLPIDE